MDNNNSVTTKNDNPNSDKSPRLREPDPHSEPDSEVDHPHCQGTRESESCQLFLMYSRIVIFGDSSSGDPQGPRLVRKHRFELEDLEETNTQKLSDKFNCTSNCSDSVSKPRLQLLINEYVSQVRLITTSTKLNPDSKSESDSKQRDFNEFSSLPSETVAGTDNIVQSQKSLSKSTTDRSSETSNSGMAQRNL